MADDDLRKVVIARGAFFEEAWRAYHANRGVLFAAMQVPSIAALPGIGAAAALSFGGQTELAVPVGIGLVFLLSTLASPGVLRVCVRVARHEPCTLADLGRDLDRGPALLAVAALIAAPVIVVSMGGMALFCVYGTELQHDGHPTLPGAALGVTVLTNGWLLSMVGNRLILASYFVVDSCMDPLTALGASWRAMAGIGFAATSGEAAVDRELSARKGWVGPIERPATHMVEQALMYLYLAGLADVPVPTIEPPKA